MKLLSKGLYDTLLTDDLEQRLNQLGAELEVSRRRLSPADAPDRIARHIAKIVEAAVTAIGETERVADGIALARKIVELVLARNAPDLTRELPLTGGEMLKAITGRRADGQPDVLIEPLIPLLDTTLLTNAPGEPGVANQLHAEIQSATQIDLIIAFIRYSGLSLFEDKLRAHLDGGKRLRVLTTTYTGSTEAKALEALQKMGAEIRVSYDTTSTRLHAKAWLFHRDSGFSTAYLGSSNLTHSAQISGIEWNVRLSQARNAGVVSKMSAVFESYWNNADFRPYEKEEFSRFIEDSKSASFEVVLSPTDVRPEPFQERLLEQVALARQQGRHRNLLVSATGTGKTVMAALFYAQIRQELPRARLLFVAHREELLLQSLATFRQVLRDPTFGELWVGGKRPESFENTFASIQSLNATKLAHIDADYYDVVIVDEFHHAAAASYTKLLNHLKPRELLGLTATPERSDGLSILDWFDGRIAAELRIWDAIDQQRLVPFVYFGIHDGLDLSEVPWQRGRGYDIAALSGLVTGNDMLVNLVLKEISKRVSDISKMRALGFCVSIQHARFMANSFEAAGVPAKAVWSDTPEAERRQALMDLAAGTTKVLFSVDLFNEGVDVPSVDTLLMLRPTESPTVFLQQLGRGLRRHIGKTACLVLDFVGLHRKEFRFDRRFRALLGVGRKEMERQIDQGFPFLPAGCFMQLDRVAKEIVLRSIRSAIPSTRIARVQALRDILRDRGSCTLSAYLHETGMDLEDVYGGNTSWSDLKEAADYAMNVSGPSEGVLRKAIGRVLHLDDMQRIEAYQRLLSSRQPPNASELSDVDRRLLRMLVVSITSQAVQKGSSIEAGVALLWQHPQVVEELQELLEVLKVRLEHVTMPIPALLNVPLQIHARYTRLEVLAAFDIGTGSKSEQWREGVRWLEKAKVDLLLFTLDKSHGQFSPTTRYRDYAISPTLVHWESQSNTREDSPTGMRYQEHERRGSHVLLFARHSNEDRSFYFLGPAKYRSHRSERPMAVTWELDQSLPGDLFNSFAAAVA